MASKAPKRLPTGKSRYAHVPIDVVFSPAVSSLRTSSLRLLLMAACQYRGANNGSITLPFTQCKRFGFSGRSAMQRAVSELLDRGLLVVTFQGKRGSTRLATRYALGWLSIDASDNPKIDATENPIGNWMSWGSETIDTRKTPYL